MKKLGFALILTVVLAAFGNAATTPVKIVAKAAVTTEETKVQTSVTSPSPIDTLRALPLSVRKQTVESQYRDLLSRLTAISTRTQTTIDRLSDKQIDTVAAQASLTAANLSLQSAKLTIDAFASIQVPEGKDDTTIDPGISLSLKASAQKTEEYFKNARESLIQTLSLLKTSISEKATVSEKNSTL